MCILCSLESYHAAEIFRKRVIYNNSHDFTIQKSIIIVILVSKLTYLNYNMRLKTSNEFLTVEFYLHKCKPLEDMCVSEFQVSMYHIQDVREKIGDLSAH